MCFPVDRDEILYPEGINVVKIRVPLGRKVSYEKYFTCSYILLLIYFNLLIVIGYCVLNLLLCHTNVFTDFLR